MHKELWAISSKPREEEIGRYGKVFVFCKLQPVNPVLTAFPLGEPTGSPRGQMEDL